MTALRARPGVALAAVLWIVAVAAVIGASIQLTARELTSAVENRVSLNRLRWQVYGCGEAVVATLVHKLSGPTSDPAWRRKWLAVGRDIRTQGSDDAVGCDVSAIPAGSRFSVRSLMQPSAKALAVAHGTAADPLALSDALHDWEDADDRPRRLGAEGDWYLARLRPVPRNDTVRSYEELRLVRGFADWPRLESTLTLDDAPVAINVAPREVLATLPGFSAPAADEVIAKRERGLLPASHQELLNLLSAEAAERLLRSFSELTDRAVLDPWEWEIVIVAYDAGRGLRVRESFSVIPSDAGVSVREFRQW